MTDPAQPDASPLCRVNSAVWLRHDIAPDGVCRRCQMRFGGLRVAVDEPEKEQP